MAAPRVVYAGPYCIVQYPDTGSISVTSTKEGTKELANILNLGTAKQVVSPHLLELRDIILHGSVQANYHTQARES